MPGCNKARENLQSACSYRVVVIAAPKFHSPHLRNAQTAPLRPVIEGQFLQVYDTVNEAVQLQIGASGGHIVKYEHSGALLCQELLESENFSPIPQRVLCQKPHLRKRVDDDSRRSDAFDLVKKQP